MSMKAPKLRLGIARCTITFDDIAWGESIYRFTNTIDHGEADKAWETLNSNEWAIEFANMPRILHNVLLETLKKRGFAAIAKR